MPKNFNIGLDLPVATDLKASLSDALSHGYKYLVVHLTHPKLKRNTSKFMFTRSDLTIGCNDWSSLIVGKFSPWLELESPHKSLRERSEEIFVQEFSFGMHLSLSAMMLRLKERFEPNLARFVVSRLSDQTYPVAIWCLIPLTSPKYYSDMHKKDDAEPEDTWHWWNSFQLMCDGVKNLGIALEVTPDLPSDAELTRWFGEPIKVVIFPTSLFLTNNKGFPVLSAKHQNFVRECAKHSIHPILSGLCKHSSLAHYEMYLKHLYMTTNIPQTYYTKGFEDHLQIPLQPLMDNLEMATYDVFEKDPIKYTSYENAIHKALLDRIQNVDKSTVIVVMVVGAGRGPLVNASLSAAQKANVTIKLYALEKNPSALNTLGNLKATLWGNRVEVINSDMRTWNAPEKCDILVSELLGSFGDNELSPECLDGAEKFLKDDGISIPCEYTSYLAPIQTFKIFNEIRNTSTKDKAEISQVETPYVVCIVNKYLIAEAKPVFKFLHPNRDKSSNNRYIKLNFKVTLDCILNGFAGYFETVLYKDVMLSINPATYSEGMCSWFPYFFPLKAQVPLKEGDDLELNFWRRGNRTHVWYEWAISKPVVLPIHNPNGRSSNIGLN